MKQHIASPGLLGTEGREHGSFGQTTPTQLQPIPRPHKSAEAALAELAAWPRARVAQITADVGRKKPAEFLLSEAASPGMHAGGHPQAEESEAPGQRPARPPARKTKNA